MLIINVFKQGAINDTIDIQILPS